MLHIRTYICMCKPIVLGESQISHRVQCMCTNASVTGVAHASVEAVMHSSSESLPTQLQYLSISALDSINHHLTHYLTEQGISTTQHNMTSTCLASHLHTYVLYLPTYMDVQCTAMHTVSPTLAPLVNTGQKCTGWN